MSFNIEEFKAKGLPLGGARPTHFTVDLFPPAVLGLDAEKIRFTCRASSIPPAIVDPVEIAYFGRRVKYSGDRRYPDWNITVMLDADWFAREMFERWSSAINTTISNVMRPEVFPLSYKTSAEVTQYRGDGEIIATYLFEGLFPTMIGDVMLDWENSNQIETFDVTFAYDYWLASLGGNLARSSTEGTEAEDING
jgi:hypothetical protein